MARKTQHDFVLVGKDRASKVIKGVAKTTDHLIDKTFKLTNTISSSINIVSSLSRGMTKLAGAMAKPIELAAEQARVEAQLQAVLESTGHTAGLTADQLKDMAGELQGVTTYGDEAVISAQSLLLTFTNIGGAGGIFERTTKVVADVATAMNMDLNSAAVQLGKALNDPVTGLSMLTRVGITFSEEQKTVIKSFAETNQIAKAQSLILDELERQFGGSAEAAANTFAGAMSQVKNAVGDAMERVGDFIVQNEGVIAIVKKAAGSVLELADGLGKLGADQEGQIKIAEIFQRVVVGLINTFATFIDVLGAVGATLLDITIQIAEFLDVEALLTAEQRRLKPEIEALESKIRAMGNTIAQSSIYAKDNVEETNRLREEQRKLIPVLEQLKEEYDAAGFSTEKITATTDLASMKMREFGAGLLEVDVSAAIVSAELAELEAKEVGVTAAAKAAAVAVGELNAELGVEQVSAMRDLNREVFVYIDALRGEFPQIARQQSALYQQVKRDIEGLPLEEQIEEIERFKAHMDALWNSAVGGSAEAAAAIGHVGVAAKDAAAMTATAKAGVEDSVGGDMKAIVPTLVAEANRAEVAWQQSAERMGGSLASSLNDAYKNSITGQATLYDGLQNFNETFKSSLTSAFMDPILGAQSPLATLFEAALSPVAALGSAISEMIFAPMIEGILAYFGVKKGAEAADAAASTGVQAATAATIAGTQMASVAAMLPGLFTAASLALVSTFGGAAAAAALLPGIVTAALGQASAAQGLTLAGFAEGGFVERDQIVRVGEGNKAEVIIPLTKRDRARELISQVFARHPEFLDSIGIGGSSRSSAASGGARFNITVNGVAEPELASSRVVHKIDRDLGRMIRRRGG